MTGLAGPASAQISNVGFDPLRASLEAMLVSLYDPFCAAVPGRSAETVSFLSIGHEAGSERQLGETALGGRPVAALRRRPMDRSRCVEQSPVHSCLPDSSGPLGLSGELAVRYVAETRRSRSR